MEKNSDEKIEQKDIRPEKEESGMDDEGHSPRKGKMSGKMWAGVGLIILGIVLGAYFYPYVEPLVHPERAALVEKTQTIQTQNAMLKQQVDCLVNGINLNHGKTTVSECT